MPIVVAMFPGQKNLEMMIISVAAVLAGAVCGDHISPISDTTVMSSAGAQSNHINHVSTQMQYAMVVAAVCIVGYLIAGIVKQSFDFVCSTDGFEETRAEKGCGGTACVT